MFQKTTAMLSFFVVLGIDKSYQDCYNGDTDKTLFVEVLMDYTEQMIVEEKISQAKKEARQKEKQAWKEFKKKDRASFWADFKKFITRGNVIDMAVAVVVATAFNAIVNGLVKQIITPCVTYFTSGVSIDEWEHILRPEIVDEAGKVLQTKISIQYGLWIQSIIDFIIIAFSVFVFVRIINNTRKKLNWHEEMVKAEADAKKKADEKAAADKAAAEAAAKAAEKAAIEAEYYANVKEQAALLREIKDILNRK